jgi:hypothetical protein
MSKIALRIRKVSTSSISKMQQHNERSFTVADMSTREKKSIDLTKTHLNKTLYFTEFKDDYAAAIADKTKNVKRKIKADAVKAVELIFSTDKEFLSTSKNMKDFAETTIKMLKAELAEQLIAVHIHRDEQNFHIHAVVCPISSDKLKLSAKELFGNSKSDRKYKFWQDLAGEYFEKIGIQRGTKNSTAKHKTIAQYQAEVNKAAKTATELKKTDITRDEAINQLAIKSSELQHSEKEIKRLMTLSTQQKTTIIEQRQQIADLTAELKSLDVELVLTDFLSATQDSKDKNKFRTADNQVISINKRDNTFKIWNNSTATKGARGAIDLVMQVLKVDFKTARNKLAAYFDSSYVAKEVQISTYATTKLAEQQVKEATKVSALTLLDSRTEKRVENYLYRTRNISLKNIKFLIDNNYLAHYQQGKFVNLVFLSADKESAEITGANSQSNSKFKQNRGTGIIKIAATAQSSVEELKNKKLAIVAESVIDLISYCQIHNIDLNNSEFDLISTSGNAKVQSVIEELKHYDAVIIATDNDDAGDSYANAIAAAHKHTTRARAHNKDFNADLCSDALKQAEQDKKKEQASVFKTNAMQLADKLNTNKQTQQQSTDNTMLATDKI